MARNGFDVRELKKFRDNLVKLEENIDSVLEDCAKELAARLIRAVAKRTYPGKPPNFETEFKRKRKKPNPEKEAKEHSTVPLLISTE